MEEIQLKLRFQISSPQKQEDLVNLLKKKLSKNTNEIYGPVLKDYAIINLPLQDQHIWSPQLGIDFIEEKSGTVIKGSFGPKQSIWLFFMFIYIVCGFVTIFGSIIGMSQFSMGKPLTGLYPLPICLLFSLGVYYSSVQGKRKSRPQMVILMNFILEALDLKAL
jgi:hypothetical protein